MMYCLVYYFIEFDERFGLLVSSAYLNLQRGNDVTNYSYANHDLLYVFEEIDSGSEYNKTPLTKFSQETFIK